MKTLHFKIRGEYYKAKENGNMLQENNTYNKWDASWKLLGISTHHMQNRIIIDTKELFDDPEKMIGGYLWDNDHGTTRLWAGCYNGKLPRVTASYVTETH